MVYTTHKNGRTGDGLLLLLLYSIISILFDMISPTDMSNVKQQPEIERHDSLHRPHVDGELQYKNCTCISSYAMVQKWRT